MPFNFLRKKGPPAPTAPAPVADPTPEVIEAAHRSGGVAFDGLTEEWRLMGVMNIKGRLSDALNKREAIAIADVSWAPVDGSDAFTPVPGLKSVDPYDLIVVLAGEGTLPPLSDAEKVAHKVHKVPYDVVLEAPPFRVVGTVYMFAGTEPERLGDAGAAVERQIRSRAGRWHAGVTRVRASRRTRRPLHLRGASRRRARSSP